MSQQLLSWTWSTAACASKLAVTTSYPIGNGSKTAVSWRPGISGGAAVVQPRIRGLKLPHAEVFFAENTVSTYKYTWSQCAGHVKHPIIKVKWILRAVIQHKRKPWSWLPSWHKTNLDGVTERNVCWTQGIKCCHSNPIFVGGHVEANLLLSCRLWVMILPCWEWGSNTGVHWATPVYTWWGSGGWWLVYLLLPGRHEKGHLCH